MFPNVFSHSGARGSVLGLVIELKVLGSQFLVAGQPVKPQNLQVPLSVSRTPVQRFDRGENVPETDGGDTPDHIKLAQIQRRFHPRNPVTRIIPMGTTRDDVYVLASELCLFLRAAVRTGAGCGFQTPALAQDAAPVANAIGGKML